jgi:hypothetical protein
MVILAIESLCILAGTLPLALGYVQVNLPLVAIGSGVVGAFWLLSQRFTWPWAASVGLAAFVGLAGTGLWFGLNPIWMALSVLGSLLAWDLTDFSRRLSKAAPEDDLAGFKKKHFIRMASLGAGGLGLFLAATAIHLRISFGWTFLLVLVAGLGLVQLVGRLRKVINQS